MKRMNDKKGTASIIDTAPFIKLAQLFTLLICVILRILIAGVRLKYLLDNISADGSGFTRSKISIVALFQVNTELASNFILHIVKLCSASGSVVGCH